MSDAHRLIFIFACFLFFAFGRPERSWAWCLIGAFAAVDSIINPIIPHIHYLVAGAVLPFKDIVLAYLIARQKTPFSCLQSIVVLAVGIAGFTLCFDLVLDADLVYSNYETVITLLYGMQLMIGSDGIASNLSRAILTLFGNARACRESSAASSVGQEATQR